MFKNYTIIKSTICDRITQKKIYVRQNTLRKQIPKKYLSKESARAGTLKKTHSY